MSELKTALEIIKKSIRKQSAIHLQLECARGFCSLLDKTKHDMIAYELAEYIRQRHPWGTRVGGGTLLGLLFFQWVAGRPREEETSRAVELAMYGYRRRLRPAIWWCKRKPTEQDKEDAAKLRCYLIDWSHLSPKALSAPWEDEYETNSQIYTLFTDRKVPSWVTPEMVVYGPPVHRWVVLNH